ncbi:lysophospholipid acyltransferase family protein [Jeotgalibacillus haloalkalitolerans]|uniref:Lysophospholipid acyltransferase family protein n=1 Tax=Jeotgalibacillus haloalkalitolerans TaxID=3104292 RepID=A0ABU5KL92_9BACL|nr:lysophospholipid acyltransferase family protein [Jeotgalibacillus sp. HH7-29]MDZ5712026.1 lysophospholipid acyltransferase family protein [Jeotgalibacillus sp. HH7-29]
MNLYGFAKGLVKSVLTPAYRIRIVGKEHIPEEGGVLICANHINVLDPPVVGITSPRPVSFMAKEELFKMPVLKKLLPNLNAFPVKRGMSDREALRKGLSQLKEGNVVGLFPEGTRSKDGVIGKGLAGAGFFALRSDAAVVPCAIIGPYKISKRLKVVYGKPINMAELKERKASAAEVTDIIMNEIKTLSDNHR